MNFGDKYRFVNIVIMLSLVLIFQGCEKGVFYREGREVTREFLLEEFDVINVAGIFDIELSTDSLFSVKLYSHEATIDDIEFIIDGTTLILSDNNPSQWLPDYPRTRIVVSFPDISRIITSEPCSILSNDTLFVHDLSIETMELFTRIDLLIDAYNISLVTHTQDFGVHRFRGKTNNASFRVTGAARLDASGLRANYTNIFSRTVADSYVYAKDRLVAGMRHYGNIIYYGDPEEIEISEMSSRGHLIPGDQ